MTRVLKTPSSNDDRCYECKIEIIKRQDNPGLLQTITKKVLFPRNGQFCQNINAVVLVSIRPKQPTEISFPEVLVLECNEKEEDDNTKQEFKY